MGGTPSIDPDDPRVLLAGERTTLAQERTRLARERTFASWLRTGLGTIAAGAVIAKLAENEGPSWLPAAIGVVLALTGALILAIGGWSYRRTRRMARLPGERGPIQILFGALWGIIFAVAFAVALLLIL